MGLSASSCEDKLFFTPSKKIMSSGKIDWCGAAPFINESAYRKYLIDTNRHIGESVHWAGTVVAVDNSKL